ncbi:hypothetical protein A8B78_04345 [Jannaschia sp. EhC01]|nr:hypothetical protein A8B78_04345 [Jannaschia sp. EhC01]
MPILSEAKLDPILAAEPDLVSEALRGIYADQDPKVSLDALREVAEESGGLFSTAELLVSVLVKHNQEGRFVNYLRPRGIDLDPAPLPPHAAAGLPAFCAGAPGGPVNVDFPFDVLERFTREARAFRCLIRIDGVEMGSGAFVSPRLVLTAAHVVETLTDALDLDRPEGIPLATLPKLDILASDGRTYPARLAWFLPAHADEHQGRLPPAAAAVAHADAALLRVDRPLGRLFGAIRLPDPPVDWAGCGRFMLVHYPDGVQQDFAPGWIRRNGRDDIRQQHDVMTEGGSSGGPGFDRDGQFLGLHQGRWNNVRRLVPYDQFANNPAFLEEIASDLPPRYLWSLEGSLDGHLLIGRAAFYDSLTAIVEGSARTLRGVWVKRTRTERDEGLSFSYRILQAFLKAQGKPHLLVRLSTELANADLIGQLRDLVFTAEGADSASIGVLEDETTPVAHDDDRAEKLADALAVHAAKTKRTIWIYFDNPPSGLLQETQIQLEHMVEELIQRPGLRLVLAGFETYDLLPEQFSSVAAARQSAAPGLFVEYLANFKRADVEVTAKGISDALGLKWSGALLTEMVDRALKDVPEMAANVYSLEQLGKVADQLRREAKASCA